MKHRMIIWSVNPETESRSVIDILEGMLFRIEIVPEDRT